MRARAAASVGGLLLCGLVTAAPELEVANWGNYPGRVVAHQEWVDSSGRNVVVIKETGDIASPPHDGMDYLKEAHLHAYQLRRLDGGWQQVWHVQDFVRPCPLDLAVEYAPGSLQVTDLDGNGVREVTFVYSVFDCAGDVAPRTLKLILQDSARKYAVRGTTVIRYANDEGGETREGGAMKMDAAFREAPPAFTRHALALWQKYQQRLMNGI